MLALAVLLLVLWGASLLASFTLGGLIHILFVVALLVLVEGLFRGRRPSASALRLRSPLLTLTPTPVAIAAYRSRQASYRRAS